MPIKKNKYNARFPPARIKKIMQSDEEIGKVAAAVPVLISRSLEMFVETLVSKTYNITMKRGARTLTPSHIKLCVGSETRFDFLKDLVDPVPDLLGDRDDQPSTPTTKSAEPKASFSGAKSEKSNVKAEGKKVNTGKKASRKLPRQISAVRRTRGRKPGQTTSRTTKPTKEKKKPEALSSEKTSSPKEEATSAVPASTSSSTTTTATKSKGGRKKKRQVIFDDDDDEDVPLKKPSTTMTTTKLEPETPSTNGTNAKLSPARKTVEGLLETKISVTESAATTLATSPATTSTSATATHTIDDSANSIPISEPPKPEPSAPPPKPFRPNHIPAQLVSASAMAMQTTFHRRVAFKSRSDNLQSGPINFTLSYALPVKDPKRSSGASTPGLTSLAKSDQPAKPNQPTTVSPAAAPWSSQGGIDEDYDA